MNVTRISLNANRTAAVILARPVMQMKWCVVLNRRPSRQEKFH